MSDQFVFHFKEIPREQTRIYKYCLAQKNSEICGFPILKTNNLGTSTNDSRISNRMRYSQIVKNSSPMADSTSAAKVQPNLPVFRMKY